MQVFCRSCFLDFTDLCACSSVVKTGASRENIARLKGFDRSGFVVFPWLYKSRMIM